MSDPDPSANAPILNLPRMVGWLIALNVLVHAARYFVPNDNALVEAFAIVPARYGAGDLDWTALVAPVTYQFLHGGLAHLGINMLSLAAFGSGVERVIGPRRMLAFYLLTGIAAAAAQYAADPASPVPIIGASGAISGLFGGVLMLLRDTRGSGGGRQLLILATLWIGMSVLGGMGGGIGGEAVAWVAHIGGFLAGMALWRPFSRDVY